MPIFLFFVILLVLVLVHEFGHFITAKKFGIRVDEFGFGFPPKLFSKKWGETTYSFNALPFGGFVKIFGEDPSEENTSGPDSARSFVNKPKYVQVLVLFAGIFFNFLLAWLFLSVGFMSGLPTSTEGAPKGVALRNESLVIVGVLKGSPAEISGLKIGDKIISIGSGMDRIGSAGAVLAPDAVQKFIGGAKIGDKFDFDISRAGAEEHIVVASKEGVVSGKPGVGISLDTLGIVKLPVFKALWQGLKNAGSLTYSTAVSFAKLVRDSFLGRADLSSITGPVGIVGIVGDAYQFGIVYLLSFAALISINLAVINLIPFPALDGGRLLFVAIEKIMGRPINPKVANALNTVGFGLLLLLMAFVTYHDIARILHH